MTGGNNIFSKTDHLTTEQILNYLGKSLSRQELHEVENHLADCELCSDAVEGSRKLEADTSLIRVTSELQKLVRKRTRRRRKIFSQPELISIFAVIFLILFVIALAMMLFWKK